MKSRSFQIDELKKNLPKEAKTFFVLEHCIFFSVVKLGILTMSMGD